MLRLLFVLLTLPAWANSVNNFIALDGPGGSFTTFHWPGVTNLYGTEDENNFSLDLWALDNNGINSNFQGGGIAFFSSAFDLNANLYNVQFDPTTGVLTAFFVSCFPELMPGMKKYRGIITGTFHDTLLNGKFGNGYLTDVQSTVPEPGTLMLMGIGLLGIAAKLRRHVTSNVLR